MFDDFSSFCQNRSSAYWRRSRPSAAPTWSRPDSSLAKKENEPYVVSAAVVAVVGAVVAVGAVDAFVVVGGDVVVVFYKQ